MLTLIESFDIKGMSLSICDSRSIPYSAKTFSAFSKIIQDEKEKAHSDSTATATVAYSLQTFFHLMLHSRNLCS